jgi:hypothetical protein
MARGPRGHILSVAVRLPSRKVGIAVTSTVVNILALATGFGDLLGRK